MNACEINTQDVSGQIALSSFSRYIDDINAIHTLLAKQEVIKARQAIIHFLKQLDTSLMDWNTVLLLENLMLDIYRSLQNSTPDKRYQESRHMLLKAKHILSREQAREN